MEKEESYSEYKDISKVADSYFHLSPNVIYSPVNVPGVGANIEECESQFTVGCKCANGVCTIDNNCHCIVTYGRNYDDNFNLLIEKFKGPIMECNSSCLCITTGKCNNSVVRKGPVSDLEIYDSEVGKGKGIRANVNLHCGTFICEYAGEIIGEEEAFKRMQSRGSQAMNYIFHLNEHLASGITIHTIVDPTYIGNVGRYINHSCEPNCIVVPVRIDSPVPRLAIFASQDIPFGEELTFDYGSGVEKRNDMSKRKCLCGKRECRQFLPYDDLIVNV